MRIGCAILSGRVRAAWEWAVFCALPVAPVAPPLPPPVAGKQVSSCVASVVAL